jgi:hypothetical protein
MQIGRSQHARTVHDDDVKRLAGLPGCGDQQMNPAILESAQAVEFRCRQPGQHRSVADGQYRHPEALFLG